jgi:hypothetical protein
MLVHYFGGRENIEEQVITRLEDKLRSENSCESALGTNDRAGREGRLAAHYGSFTPRLERFGCARALYEGQRRLWGFRALMRILPTRANARSKVPPV